MNKFKNKNNHHFILPDTEFGVTQTTHLFLKQRVRIRVRVRVLLQEETPAQDWLNRGEGDLAVGVSELLLSDGVARHPGHQGRLLLGATVRDGEGDNTDTAGYFLPPRGPSCDPEEVSDKPAAQVSP